MARAESPPADLVALRRDQALTHLAWMLAFGKLHGWRPDEVARWVFRCHQGSGTYEQQLRSRGAGNVRAMLESHVRSREAYCTEVRVRPAGGTVAVVSIPAASASPLVRTYGLAVDDLFRFLAAQSRLTADALAVSVRWETGAPGETAAFTLPEGDTWKDSDLGTPAPAALPDRLRQAVCLNLTMALGVTRAVGAVAEDLGRHVMQQQERAGLAQTLGTRVRQDLSELALWLARERLAFTDEVSLVGAGSQFVVESRSFVPGIAHALGLYGVSPEDFGRFFNGMAEVLSVRLGLRVAFEVGLEVFRTSIRSR